MFDRPNASTRLSLWMAAVTLTVSAAAFAQEDAHTGVRMYRYTNNKGVMVTGSTISPEYARKGYQIVNLSGTVLETVPAEPTPEERALLEQQNKDKLSEVQQHEVDKLLLLRYSSMEELQSSKERKLAEIETKIKLLQGNVSGINQQLQFEQQNAAQFERSGKPVPQATLDKLASLQKELKNVQEQQVSRKQELEAETARFDKEIERFNYLDQRRAKR
jgi:hypothetical protein